MANGQVYTIEMMPSGWVVIADPEPADVCGLACIKGRWVTSNKDNWASDRPTYVPIAHIKSIISFDSAKDYFEAGKRSRLADFPKEAGPHQT